MEQRRLDLNNWREEYEQKLVSPEEAARVIKSGDNIFIPNAYYGQLVHSIVARREELRDVQVEITAPLFDPGWLSPGMEESFNVIVKIFLFHWARMGHDEGRISYQPYSNGTWFKPFRDNRPVPRDINVLLVEVSPPDENGFCTFGQNVWEAPNYAKKAKTIIAEIDSYKIRSYGDTSIHVSQIDYLVESSAPPLTKEEIEKVVSILPPEKHDRGRQAVALAHPRQGRNVIPLIEPEQIPVDLLEYMFNLDDPNDVMKAITANLKTILRDRDTIQIGLGKHTRHIVELGVFDDLNDLSLFSEMACPGMGFLVKRGIATGKYAALHPGKAVFTGLTGMRPEEILWINDNPLFELYSSDYVVNIVNVSRNENMVSINNAIQIDLTGQITCESQFGPRLINGPGGQIECHIGAFLSPGGRAVTILPSTWGEGAVSNIKPYLDEGAVVSIPKVFADHVVTEWGVAQLAGKTHQERAEELIRVAHPDFRDELKEAAKQIW